MFGMPVPVIGTRNSIGFTANFDPGSIDFKDSGEPGIEQEAMSLFDRVCSIVIEYI